MKKLLALTLAVVMLFAYAMPATVSAAADPDTAILEGVGFHCNHGGSGNGKTDVYYSETGPKSSTELFDAKGKLLKGVAADTGTKFKFDFVRIDETTWKLVSENYYCVECGNNIWASYSNKSGVPNGKNIQVNPYTPPTPPPLVDYGTLSIQKTVGGTPFDVWAIEKELNKEQKDAIIAGMSFTAYLLDGENGNRVVPEMAFEGEINPLTGQIDFGSNLPIGWYEVVEGVSGGATNYFVGEGGIMVYYVGKDGVSSEVENFVSGQEGIGTIVSHDGTGVNWPLPKVWSDFFTGNADAESKANYAKLMEMGAQWIWDKEDTYITGINGDAIALEFDVTLAKAIEVPLYFAADNAALIYVNDKLAAYTTVALANKGISIGDDYIGIDVFGEKTSASVDGRWTEGWNYAYKANINLPAGTNEIKILAVNSASTGYIDDNGNFVKGETGTDNDGYNYANNPCGLIFGFEIPAVTFDNEPILVEYGSATVFVGFNVVQDTVTFEEVTKPKYETVKGSSFGNTLTTFGGKEVGQGNGMTYVEVDVAAAKTETLEFDISNANTKSPSSGFKYFVNIDENDVLHVTFEGSLAKISAGMLIKKEGEMPKNPMPELKNDNNFNKPLPEGYGDVVELFLHIEANGTEWSVYIGEEFDYWNEIGRDTNDVDADVTELIVELWLGEDLIASQNITDEIDFIASFPGLEDGEYTVIVKGIANGVTFEKTGSVTVVDKSSETAYFPVQIVLDDFEIYL